MKLLFSETETIPPRPPQTRFQGSKYKLLDWIWDKISKLEFNTVLDTFGGTACVSHFLKGRDKVVTYNDILRSNYLCGVALVKNDNQILLDSEVEYIITKQPSIKYDDLIYQTFQDIYYTNEENAWLDVVAQNIPLLNNRYKQAIAYYALFQAAISKRPYNLFHRKNLYIRTAKVKRGFGNKTTWDKSFDSHFRKFVGLANESVFSLGQKCNALNLDANKVEGNYDLVYIDTPYMNGKGVSVDYHGFYHFLEGLAGYKNWLDKIDFKSKHRRLKRISSPWTNKKVIHNAFQSLFHKFKQSILVVSYRTDGIPSPDELVTMMREVKRNVSVQEYEGNYKYVLSKNHKSSELLVIGTD